MKLYLTFCIFLLIFSFNLKSQEISFTFSANHNCAYAPSDSIIIENLTQSGDTTLYWNDTVLTFIFTNIDGINKTETDFYVTHNYPNPFETKTEFDVFVSEKNVFSICIYDLTGKEIASHKSILNYGIHNFTFYAGNSRSYVLEVKSERNRQSIQMLNFGNEGVLNPEIIYNGMTNRKEHLIKNKSNRMYFPYNIGDELSFTCYVSSDYLEIIDSPTESDDYYFEVANYPPNSPLEGLVVSEYEQIEWNWSEVSSAIGYKYNTTDDFANATDNGTNTTFTQSGLTCGTTYNLFVWAYNACGESAVLSLNASTNDCNGYGEPCPGMPTFTDIRDGTVYSTVQIGNQCWMAENLAYLPSVVPPETGSQTEPYYYVYEYYGTDVTTAKSTANYINYGVLYNWPAAMDEASGSDTNPSGVQGVCPDGWHLPSDAEWIELREYLGGYTIAGGKLKETGTTHWDSPNTGATNETGFTARPGGIRDFIGDFYYIGSSGYWWTTSEENINYAYYRRLGSNHSHLFSHSFYKQIGRSVRCIKD